MLRYAIYYAPRPGAFAAAAAAWLGWDPASGTEVPHCAVAGLPLPLAELTHAPGKYGFHGTIKPPFRLAEGVDEAALQAATAVLAMRLELVELPGLVLSRIGGFLALTPQGDPHSLTDLAAAVVAGLDRFRAPLTDADIARRNPDGLTVTQRDLLSRWGYPYVMEQFQFHLTLTGDLGPDVADATAVPLAAYLADVLPRPFLVQDLCLFGEDGQGRFHLLHRHALSG